MKTHEIIVTPPLRKRLLALTGCASTDPGRPVLNTLLFSEGSAWASDSYVLGRIELPDLPKSAKWLVPAGPLKAALKSVRKSDQCTLSFDQDLTVRIERPSLLGNPVETHTIQYVEGKAPNFKSLLEGSMKRLEDGEPTWVDPARLTVVAALSEHTDSAVQFVSTGAEKPAVVADAGGVVLGLVMPMRVDSKRAALKAVA